MQDYATIFDSLLSDLRGFGDPGFMSSDMSPEAARAFSLRNSFYKKLSPLGQSPEADATALEKFKVINKGVKDADGILPESEVESLLWDYFRDNMRKVLDFDVSDEVNFDLEFIRGHFSGGPGASLGCDSESFYTKFFASRITATSEYLVTLYRAAISGSDTWSRAEKQRDERFGHEIVEGNKLFFVPKTSEISRTCCTEPFLNMLIQKAVGAFVEYRLARHFGISLRTQPDNNRELARIGSIDGSFGTIDLTSASDSMSWSLVQRVVPQNLLGYLRLSRCESTILPDGTKMDLRMISTMGNGFTFPLQSVIFACAVRSVYQLQGLTCSCPKTQFGVFGDDIVVRAQAYASVVRLLTLLGFEVNEKKSFNVGMFRESCGEDWYRGHNIRGIYIRSLETRSEVYSAINRLNKWSALAGIPLPETVSLLKELVGNKTLFVPPSEADDAGIQVPFSLTVPKVTNAYWFAYRKSVNVKRRRKVPLDAQESKDLGYAEYNQYGWAIATLGGYTRRDDPGYYPGPDGLLNPICLEDKTSWLMLRDYPGDLRRYKVVRTSIPFWDWPGLVADNLVKGRRYSHCSWAEAVAANLRLG